MMKKSIVALLLAALLTLSFAGCGAEKTTEEKKPSAVPSTSTSEESGETPTGIIGYSLKFGNNELGVGSTIGDVKVALGDDCILTEEASCFFEGAQDRNYTYANVSVTTYSKDGGEYVYYIKLLNDLVSTPEGLSIGDAESKVETLYGSDFTVKGSYKCYEKDGMTLRIRISDEGDVSGIDYTMNS